jgi:hypothetical protein
MKRERYLALHGHVAATDDADIGGGARCLKGTRGHDSGTCTGADSDAVDATVRA